MGKVLEGEDEPSGEMPDLGCQMRQNTGGMRANSRIWDALKKLVKDLNVAGEDYKL